jgi:hypothetical protein
MEEFTACDLPKEFVAHRWKDEASLGEALKSHVEWRAAPKVRVYTGDSEDSSKLNTSFVERLNLTIRQGSAYLFRRTIYQA